MIERFARLALPLAALGVLAACGDSPEVLFDKARADFAAQDYQAARLEVASALRDDPGNKAMLDLLVRAHLRLNDPDGAEGAIDRLARAGGEARDLALYKAGVALMRGRSDEVLSLLGDDARPAAWGVRGQALLAKGDEKGAVAAFDKGMAAGDDMPLAEAYARYRLISGNPDGAEAVHARMQRMAPKAYETLVLAGDIAAARGQTQKAVAAFEAVTKAFPQKLPPLIALANQYDMLGAVDKAMAVVERAEKLDGGNPAVDDLRIQLLAEKGEWEKIRLAMQGQESRLVPGSGTQMKYAEALLRLGKAEQARILFKRATLALPANPYARLMLGEAELAAGQTQQAWQTLKPLAMSTLADPEELQAGADAAKAVGAPEAGALQARLDPTALKTRMAKVEAGQNALMKGEWAEAHAIYTDLLSLGEDGEVLRRLAAASEGLKQGDAAVAYADRALALELDNPDYLFMAGMLRLEFGQDRAKARRLIENAASLDPDNADIARGLKLAGAA